MINEQKETIDTIQEVGIQLTTSFVELHTITIRYAEVVNTILSTLLPIMEKIPLVPAKLVETATSIESVTKNHRQPGKNQQNNS